MVQPTVLAVKLTEDMELLEINLLGHQDQAAHLVQAHSVQEELTPTVHAVQLAVQVPHHAQEVQDRAVQAATPTVNAPPRTNAQKAPPVQLVKPVQTVFLVSQVKMVFPVWMPKMSLTNHHKVASTAQLVHQVLQEMLAVQVPVVCVVQRVTQATQDVMVTQEAQVIKDHKVLQEMTERQVQPVKRELMPNAQLAARVNVVHQVNKVQKVHKVRRDKMLHQANQDHKANKVHQASKAQPVKMVKKGQKVHLVPQAKMPNTVHAHHVMAARDPAEPTEDLVPLVLTVAAALVLTVADRKSVV